MSFVNNRFSYLHWLCQVYQILVPTDPYTTNMTKSCCYVTNCYCCNIKQVLPTTYLLIPSTTAATTTAATTTAAAAATTTN